MQPAETIRFALAAAARADVDALLRLCSDDCELRTPEGIVRGHDGVRGLFAPGPEAPPWIATGDPDDVGDGVILVPLTLMIEVGERSIDVQATAVWRVEDGLITALRTVAGGREAALDELGLSEQPSARLQSRPLESAAPGSVRTLRRDGVWVNESDPDGVLSSHLAKLPAVEAGRAFAVERRTEHLVFTADGRVVSWKDYVDGPLRPGRRPPNPRMSGL
jgi:ketosteroid isomerase-like protein